jgi:hypothetical protein
MGVTLVCQIKGISQAEGVGEGSAGEYIWGKQVERNTKMERITQ